VCDGTDHPRGQQRLGWHGSSRSRNWPYLLLWGESLPSVKHILIISAGKVESATRDAKNRSGRLFIASKWSAFSTRRSESVMLASRSAATLGTGTNDTPRLRIVVAWTLRKAQLAQNFGIFCFARPRGFASQLESGSKTMVVSGFCAIPPPPGSMTTCCLENVVPIDNQGVTSTGQVVTPRDPLPSARADS
jgi:hypothetical protein